MLYILFSALIVAVDQLVKYWAANALQGAGQVEFIPRLLNFRYAENTGAAFSMFSGRREILIVISIVASAVIVWYMLSSKTMSRFGKLSLAMVLGGAVGNMIDRIFTGYVVDYFEFAFVRFAIFNVADIFITVGGGLFVLWFLIDEVGRELREKKKAEEKRERRERRLNNARKD